MFVAIRFAVSVVWSLWESVWPLGAWELLCLWFDHCESLYDSSLPEIFFPFGTDEGDSVVSLGNDNCDGPINIPYEIFNSRTIYVSFTCTCKVRFDLVPLCLLRVVKLVNFIKWKNSNKTLVQAFVSYRLDYCNSLFFSISDGLMSRLQSVQNAAARLVTGIRRCDHITPVPRLLHWLPVCPRAVIAEGVGKWGQGPSLFLPRGTGKCDTKMQRWNVQYCVFSRPVPSCTVSEIWRLICRESASFLYQRLRSGETDFLEEHSVAQTLAWVLRLSACEYFLIIACIFFYTTPACNRQTDGQTGNWTCDDS